MYRKSLKRTLSITLALVLLLCSLSLSALAANLVATPTASRVLVDGKEISFDSYTIDGSNYFKLRDIAYTLSGTSKQFSVRYDSGTRSISLTSGASYTPDGTEMQSKGTGAKTPTLTTSRIYIDGVEVQFTAYNIQGYNYFKLRDLGDKLNFSVVWDGKNNTIIVDTTKGGSPSPPSAQWKQLYLAQMQAALAYHDSVKWESHDQYGRYPLFLTGFALADLNFDGVPELMIFGDGASASELMRIFTISGNTTSVFFFDWGNPEDLTLYRHKTNGSLAYMVKSSNGDAEGGFTNTYFTGKSTPMNSNFKSSALLAEYLYYEYEDSAGNIKIESHYSFKGETLSLLHYGVRMDEFLSDYQLVSYTPVSMFVMGDPTPSTAKLQAFLDSYVKEG